MTDNVCKCYDNEELASPMTDALDKKGAFHKYAECAGRGICNRDIGECCFDGYEDKACHRTTCPNDCYGYGNREYKVNLF
jgi:hypothetical protein